MSDAATTATVRHGFRQPEQAALTSTSPTPSPTPSRGRRFGRALALDGNTLVVGENDEVDRQPGEAHLYTRSNGAAAWTLEETLEGDSKHGDEWFGRAVAVGGDVAVVSAGGREAAYVYVRNTTTTATTTTQDWGTKQKLTPSDPDQPTRFGRTVATDGQTVVIGAAGGAYVFTRSGDDWTEQEKLSGTDDSETDRFGWSVAVSGTTVVAGSVAERCAHIFSRDASGRWSRKTVRPADTDGPTSFGGAVAIDGSTIVVGDVDHRTDDGAPRGAVYVYTTDGEREAVLQPEPTGPRTQFGWSVGVSGDTVLVGMPSESHHAADAGAVAVYTRDGSGRWSLDWTLTNQEPAAGDRFGQAVAISGGTVAVGADGVDSGSTANTGTVVTYEQQVIPEWRIETFAGGGSTANWSESANPTATSVKLGGPRGLSFAKNGSLWFADIENHLVGVVSDDGTISLVVGALHRPCSVARDDDDTVWVADLEAVYTVKSGVPTKITTDPNVATPAALAYWKGALYIADGGWPMRIVRSGSGGGVFAETGDGRVLGDGGPVRDACIGGYIDGMASGPDGSLYLAVWSDHRIRRIDADGIITTVAGTGEPGFSGDGGFASRARLNHPSAVWCDPGGGFYIADDENQRIRHVSADGIITTVAGSGDGGFSGDGGPARAARLHTPTSILGDGNGKIFVADQGNGRIRVLERSEVPAST